MSFTIGCSAAAPSTLEVLIDRPGGASLDAMEIRVYDRFHELATERIVQPALPGAVRLTSVPSSSGQLRVVALGLDSAQRVQRLDGTTLATPASPPASVAIHWSGDGSDGDGDGVPDALDDCPSVADAAQEDARGFGDGPGDACSSNCPSDGALCDDFEAPQLDPTRWIVDYSTGAVVELDHARAFSGKSSLHVHLPALDARALGYATIKERATFPTDHLYARAYILAPSAFGNEPGAFMLVEQAVSPFAGVALQLEGSGFSFYNGLHQQTVAAAGFISHDTWVCVEWQVTIANAGVAQLWVEGRAQQAPLLNGDTTSNPPVGELSVGLVSDAPNAVAARDLWIDDLVVSKQPIGCQ